MGRQSIKDKIAALLRKTQAAGCTEAEAMSAAALAADLMGKHGLDQADLVIEEATAPEPTRRPTWRNHVTGTIAYCTNTACIIVMDSVTQDCVFVGRAPGPDIAVYLRDVCFRAIEGEVKAFKLTPFYRRRRSVKTKRQAVVEFIGGIVLRINLRLREMFRPHLDDKSRAEAQGALGRRFSGAVAHRAPNRKMRFSEAADAGWRKGADIALNHAVSDPSTGTLQLEARSAS